MSFGFGVSDFVLAGKLAYDIWKECEAAANDFKELGELCREIDVAISSCNPHDPHSVLRRQHAESLARLAASCRSTLSRLQDLLRGYQDMSGFQGVGKRLGFSMTKSEREHIRRNLQEHLAAINTFLQGVQVSTFGLTVTLLFKILEDRVGSTNEDEIRAIVDNPDKLQDLFKEVRSENKDLNSELDKDKDLIRNKLKEEAKKSGKAIVLSATAGGKEPETVAAIATGPAQPSSLPYDPGVIDWYQCGGWQFLYPVSTRNALMQVILPEQTMYYSEDEAWLCTLPEGWTLIRTLVTRNSKQEDAFYHSFNNLSALPGNRPRTTRAYFLTAPFSYDTMSTASTLQPLGEIAKPFPRFKRFFPPGNTAVGCVGFHINFLPYDLGDPLSRELASMQIGSRGKQSIYPDETIDGGLPDGWTWDPWIEPKEGTQRIVYTDTVTKTESTVHPARFLNPSDETPHVLPPGWERRLDSWGQLFFVDKHSQRATREDPRFNNRIDQRTGLRKSWFEIRDHDGKQYFYTKIGQMVFGTYEPTSMNSKSQKHKLPLSRVPKDGEDPSTLVEITLPLARRIAEVKAREGAAASALADARAAATLSPATLEEKQGYHHVFRSVERSDPWRVSLYEAMEHTKNFDVPADLVGKILDRHDTNKDRRWTAAEYTSALHEIKFELKKILDARPIRPMSAEDEQKYTAIFNAAKTSDSDDMATAGVRAACKEFDLPDDLLEKILVRADDNNDGRWDIDEFIPAMHLVMHEVEKREELRKFTTVPPKHATSPTLNTALEPPEMASSVPHTVTTSPNENQAPATVLEPPEWSPKPQIIVATPAGDSATSQATSLETLFSVLYPPEEPELSRESPQQEIPILANNAAS